MFRLILVLAALCALPSWGASPDVLRERVDRLLPAAMSQNDIDLWLVFTREESKDPLAGTGGGDASEGCAAVCALEWELRDAIARAMTLPP